MFISRNPLQQTFFPGIFAREVNKLVYFKFFLKGEKSPKDQINPFQYVPASDMCTEANFQFGDSAVDTRIPIPRQWLIKITQYSCGFPNLAPNGCLQYFYGATTGVVKSFNFDGGMHLANQVCSILEPK